MNIKTLIPAFTFLLLLVAIAANSQITWPGEKKFVGCKTLDDLGPVFAKDTSAYGRRYLIQALPTFVEKNKITDAAPAWLVREIGKAVVSKDPYLSYEGILAVQRLKIYSLTDTLTNVYRKARMSFSGEMPLIHTSIVGCLAGFNRPESRQALVNIVSTPFPVKIAQDIVPALKGLSQVGDSSCINSLTVLSERLHSSEDSVAAVLPLTHAQADSITVKKLGIVVAAVGKTKQMIKARGGAR